MKQPDKRVVFPPNKQREFLLNILAKENISSRNFAKKIEVNPRTFNDWVKERYSLPLTVFNKILNYHRIKKPDNIEIKQAFWYACKGGKKAGRIVFERYGRIGGDVEYRKKQWYKWWLTKGRYSSLLTQQKPIRKPGYSAFLAEFVGIMLGDGGITEKQVVVSLNPKTDGAYLNFVRLLFQRLFGVKPSIYKRKNKSACNIVVSRKQLVEFCKSIGLKKGNKLKQKIDIPKWVKANSSFKLACLRGLFDTDGSIFNECHCFKKEKYYCYPRLAFSSSSNLIRNSVSCILEEFGFNPRIRSCQRIQLEKKEEIMRYFRLVKSNNPKHIIRFKSFIGGVG